VKVEVFQVDAFTDKPFGGNAAGVVPDASSLSDEQMRLIAREMNLSETAFVLPPTTPEADVRVRFLTPTEEVELCGHATVATFHVLKALGHGEDQFVQETLAGTLPVYVEGDRIMMVQAEPELGQVLEDPTRLCEVLGISPGDLDLDLGPVQVVSTGLRDVILPVKTRTALFKIRPNNDGLSRLSRELGVVGVHAFTLDTVGPSAYAHTRNFAPLVGIPEEAATGTSNGALGAYLVHHNVLRRPCSFSVEQGYILGRESEIYVEVGERVKVGGKAVIVLRGELFL